MANTKRTREGILVQFRLDPEDYAKLTEAAMGDVRAESSLAKKYVVEALRLQLANFDQLKLAAIAREVARFLKESDSQINFTQDSNVQAM